MNLTTRVTGMKTEHLQCRDFGHAWAPYTVESVPQRKVYIETLRCDRCHTHRLRIIKRDGSLVGGSYRYVEGYRVEGMGRVSVTSRAVMRAEVLNRLLAAQVTT
jgi:hypothetical protein